MRKFLIGAASAVALMATSGSANAAFFFDPDGDAGGTFSPTLLGQIGANATGPYTIFTDLGADGTLGNGDTFTEQFTLVATSANAPSGLILPPATTVGSFNVLINVQLSGTISNYDPGADAPTTLANAATNLADDIFTINFDAGTAEFLFDPTGDLNQADATQTAVLDLVSGGATQFSFENPTATSSLGALFEFTQVDPGVFATEGGTDYADLLGLQVLLAVADGSVNLAGVGGTPGGVGTNDVLEITVTDNGTTIFATEVPEPSTIALLGFGLLGLGWLHRRRSKVAA